MYTFVWFLLVLESNWRGRRKAQPDDRGDGEDDADSEPLFV